MRALEAVDGRREPVLCGLLILLPVGLALAFWWDLALRGQLQTVTEASDLFLSTFCRHKVYVEIIWVDMSSKMVGVPSVFGSEGKYCVIATLWLFTDSVSSCRLWDTRLKVLNLFRF